MIILKIAWRNLWRNKRRTQLTMGAMIFASALLVFSLGYYDGILWSLINNATEKESGHVVMAAKDYLDAPSLNNNFDLSSSQEKLKKSKIPEIKGFCPRLKVFALLSAGSGEKNSKTQPAEIKGLDYSKEKDLSRLSDSIVAGKFLSGQNGEIVVGKSLALKLDAEVGDEIVLFSSAANGSIVGELFKLSGIISTGDELKDSSSAFMNLKQLQDLFVLKGKVHSIRVFINNPLKAKEVTAKLAAQFKELEITSWHEIFPQISSLLNMWFAMQVITMAIYYSALALITFNTMYMAFVERIREFAIMRAVGLSRFSLSWLILGESLMIATCSGIIGSVLGTVANYIFYYYPLGFEHWFDTISWGGAYIEIRLFCVPGLSSSLLPFVSILLLGFLVAALPAFKLYRLNPVQALREG